MNYNSDKYYYNLAINCIKEKRLDKAWMNICKIKSEGLKESFTGISFIEANSLKDKIMYDHWVSGEGCDGRTHTYKTGGGSGGNEPPEGPCGCIGAIIAVGCCSIVCSINMGKCCWCAVGDLFSSIGQCLSWCHI